MTLSELRKIFGDIDGLRLVKSPSFKELTTVGTGGKARALLIPESRDALGKALSRIKGEGLEYFIFGKGSNLLVPDRGVGRLAVGVGEGLMAVNFNGVGVIAEGGTFLPRLAVLSALEGLSGLEQLSGIPGTLGGASVMNAGSFNREIGELVKWVEIVEESGHVMRLTGEQISFGYRKSDLHGKGVVSRVYLKLSRGERGRIFSFMRELNSERKEKQPWGEKTFGSVFKNPEGGYAAALIERAGLKGESIGDAVVSEKHANFIVNRGNATTFDILALMERVKKIVFQKEGSRLEPEVKFIA